MKTRTNEKSAWIGWAGSMLMVACSGAGDAPKPVVAADTSQATGTAVSAPPVVATPASATPRASSTPSVAATAEAVAAPSTQGKCGPGMAEIAGGKFKSSYYRAELEVKPFCLDTNLASTDEYTACVATGKCDKGAVHACDPSTFNVADRGKLPMICVDFGQAERYCKAQGKRIVSDLEWEWAARNGDEARVYPWGNEPPSEQLCWSGKEKRSIPCPIASFPPAPSGVFDLVGNIYQWTTTTNDSTGSFRVGRGGSWKDTAADQVKVTARGGFKNTYRCGFLGIRCSTPVP